MIVVELTCGRCGCFKNSSSRLNAGILCAVKAISLQYSSGVRPDCGLELPISPSSLSIYNSLRARQSYIVSNKNQANGSLVPLLLSRVAQSEMMWRNFFFEVFSLINKFSQTRELATSPSHRSPCQGLTLSIGNTRTPLPFSENARLM